MAACACLVRSVEKVRCYDGYLDNDVIAEIMNYSSLKRKVNLVLI